MKRAVEMEPDHHSSRVNLALVYCAGLGQFSEAVAVLEEAVARHPEYAPAHYLLGKVYLRQNRLAEALASLRRAVELNPTSEENPGWLGMAYIKSDSLAQAIAGWKGSSAWRRGRRTGTGGWSLSRWRIGVTCRASRAWSPPVRRS